MQWQFICRLDTDTAQEPGSLFWCHTIIRLQFAHVRSFACKGKLRNLLADCSAVGLYCATVTWEWIFKRSLQVTSIGVFSHVTQAPTEFFFPPRSAFLGRPGCLGLIIKNRVKSRFFSSDKIISNFNVFDNIKITLYCSVRMRTSGEKVRTSDDAERVQTVSYPQIRSLSGLFKIAQSSPVLLQIYSYNYWEISSTEYAASVMKPSSATERSPKC